MKSKYFAVVDNNLFGNKPYCKELFSRLKPLRKYWFCSGSINALNDEDLLSQGADAGLLGIEIRFESLSSNVLSEAKKIQNKYSKRPNDKISQDAMYGELEVHSYGGCVSQNIKYPSIQKITYLIGSSDKTSALAIVVPPRIIVNPRNPPKILFRKRTFKKKIIK